MAALARACKHEAPSERGATAKHKEVGMITRSKQDWSIGATVRVGFLQLRVVGARAEYDGMPDIYSLESLDGTRHYEFIPHNGLVRID
jgi:hypothetical protein